jgi:hypothetical protein
VLHFLRSGRSDRVLVLIANNREPIAREDLDILPLLPLYLRKKAIDTAEPLAADLQDNRDYRRGALLKLVAGIIGINLRELTQRDRRRRLTVRLAMATIVICTALVVSLFWDRFSELQRLNPALQPRRPSAVVLSEQQSLAVFVKGLSSTGKEIDLTTSDYIQGLNFGTAGTFNIATNSLTPDMELMLASLTPYYCTASCSPNL